MAKVAAWPRFRTTARDRPYYTTDQPAKPVESSGAGKATLKLVSMGDASVPTPLNTTPAPTGTKRLPKRHYRNLPVKVPAPTGQGGFFLLNLTLLG